VLTVAALVVVAELLGAVGLLTRVALLASCCVIGALCGLVVRRLPAKGESTHGEPVRQRGGSWAIAGAALATAAVLFQWCTYTTERLAGGMLGFDSLWYHMPFAAEFAASDSTLHLHFAQRDPTQTYYPATGELLNAIAISAFDRYDFATLFINLAAAGLALLAAWCIGQPRGVGPASLVGVAIVLITPVMLATQPGEGQNDVIGLAFLLSAVALVVGGAGRLGVLVAVGAAVGVAVSTKLSLLFPGLLVLVAVVVMADSRRRWRAAGLAVGATVISGAFWYARNLVVTGNPLPWVGVHIGPLDLPRLPTPNVDALSYSLAHYLTDGHIVRSALVPQLHVVLGDAWPVLLATTALGALLAIASSDKLLRVLGLIVVGAGIAYVVTPGSAAGPEGQPVLFGLNVRYATPALALGLAILPAARVLLPGRRPQFVVAWLVALLAITLAGTGIWPRFSYFPDAGRWWGPVFAIGLAVALVLVVRSRRFGVRRRAVVTVALVGTALATGWSAARTFEAHRYARLTGAVTVGLPAVWARHVAHSRIAVSGYILVYPLYGLRISNDVDYLGRRGPDGAFLPIRTCREWRGALNAGHYRYVVTAPENDPATGRRDTSVPAELWTKTDAGISEVLRERKSGAAVFRVDRPLDPASCPS
jgi:hypothetical protein